MAADLACTCPPSNIDTTAHNYIHYAFGSITDDYKVGVSST